MAAPELRRTGRVILMDPTYRVLLLRFSVTQAGEPFEFWATPGGRAEDDESDLEAAIRELDEELRLSVPLDGPVHVHESTFEVNGNVWHGRDVFFHGRCAANDPAFTGGTEPDERHALQEMRWWTLEELEKTAETVFPPDLATVSRQLVS
ncbi:MAG: NUDIX domain-containing protein [Candidatus Phaeomarinobacter sp.]